MLTVKAHLQRMTEFCNTLLRCAPMKSNNVTYQVQFLQRYKLFIHNKNDISVILHDGCWAKTCFGL
jgi:hypothetical protein